VIADWARIIAGASHAARNRVIILFILSEFFCRVIQKKGLYLIPTPALPGSGSMGMISARSVKAPLMYSAKLKVISSK
jgi:hypothetical protein